MTRFVAGLLVFALLPSSHALAEGPGSFAAPPALYDHTLEARVLFDYGGRVPRIGPVLRYTRLDTSELSTNAIEAGVKLRIVRAEPVPAGAWDAMALGIHGLCARCR